MKRYMFFLLFSAWLLSGSEITDAAVAQARILLGK